MVNGLQKSFYPALTQFYFPYQFLFSSTLFNKSEQRYLYLTVLVYKVQANCTVHKLTVTSTKPLIQCCNDILTHSSLNSAMYNGKNVICT